MLTLVRNILLCCAISGWIIHYFSRKKNSAGVRPPKNRKCLCCFIFKWSSCTFLYWRILDLSRHIHSHHSYLTIPTRPTGSHHTYSLVRRIKYSYWMIQAYPFGLICDSQQLLAAQRVLRYVNQCIVEQFQYQWELAESKGIGFRHIIRRSRVRTLPAARFLFFFFRFFFSHLHYNCIY